METIDHITRDSVLSHFSARANKYNASSHWCSDPELAGRITDLAQTTESSKVLDVACGTGLVSRLFHGRVARVVGCDITRAMYEQARPHLDEFVEAPGEQLPFENDSFDVAVCRQGIQFMDAPRAIAEMVRVVRPGGRVCSIDLTAYGDADRDEYFEILRLRNPARKNFFMPEDVGTMLEAAGCSIERHRHVSRENVDLWADNGAIPEGRRQRIRSAYVDASPSYRRLHSVEGSAETGFVDHMLFTISVGRVS